MRTRTNLHIDNDALEFASIYADSKGISLGVAVSELIRRAEQMPEPPISASTKIRVNKHGFPIVKLGGSTMTSEMVKEESEDEVG